MIVNILVANLSILSVEIPGLIILFISSSAPAAISPAILVFSNASLMSLIIKY